MRQTILAIIAAVIATLTFAGSSQAGGYGYNSYKKHYQASYDYQPVCFIKKIKTYDSYGYLVVKKVKVCK